MTEYENIPESVRYFFELTPLEISDINMSRYYIDMPDWYKDYIRYTEWENNRYLAMYVHLHIRIPVRDGKYYRAYRVENGVSKMMSVGSIYVRPEKRRYARLIMYLLHKNKYNLFRIYTLQYWKMYRPKKIVIRLNIDGKQREYTIKSLSDIRTLSIPAYVANYIDYDIYLG